MRSKRKNKPNSVTHKQTSQTTQPTKTTNKTSHNILSTGQPPMSDPSTAATSSSSVTHRDTATAVSEAHTALHALSEILPSPPPTALSSAANLSLSLLHDPTISASISALLRLPDSGSGDNPLCRFLYDIFQSRDPALRLLVLSHVPLISGLYLTRVSSTRLRLSGFEALLLALYSRDTDSRPALTATTVNLPKLSNPSIYHEPSASSATTAANSTELHVGVLSHALEPHGALRATCRARVVGVALEMFYSKIRHMPARSKVDFCEACGGWGREIGGLPWEVMQPALRILGHCLMGPRPGEEFLHEEARGACRSLYARALHGIDAKAILATQSLIRMMDHKENNKEVDDYTEVPRTRVISI